LLLSFLIVAVVATVIGVVGLTNITRINEADTLLFEQNTLGIKYIGDAARYYQRFKYNLAEMILYKDDSLKDNYVKNLTSYMQSIDVNLLKYKESIVTQEEQQLFDELMPQWEEFKSHMQKAIQYAQNGQYDKAEEILLVDSQESGDAVRDNLVKLVDYNEETAYERAEKNTSLSNTAKTTMIVLIIAGLIIAILLGFVISNNMSKPIRKLVETAEKLAIGDMEIDTASNRKDEIGVLSESFRKLVESTRDQAQMVERIADGDLTVDVPIRSEKDLLGKKLFQMVHNLNDLILNITSAAEQVAAGAKQISDSSMSLSQGATEQASSIEELTSSIEEVSSKTQVNAENANQANEMTQRAENYANIGNKHMQEMLNAMDEINKASSNVNKIIKVIDDIAFQTNILALNAAVEAARAGQHGKGFAVVAEEVRNLAGRSANAAKETTALIENSIKKSEAGVKIAEETAEALQKIVDEIKSASNVVGEIKAASNEQAVALEQINQGITQVSQVVSENSATSEESAAASEELSSQAEALKEMVRRFKLKQAITGSIASTKVGKKTEPMSESKYTGSKQDDMQDANNNETIVLSDNEFGKY